MGCLLLFTWISHATKSDLILDSFINVVENVKYVMQCFQDLEGVENLKCLFFAM